jgi:ParB family chromosome partitioning protein
MRRRKSGLGKGLDALITTSDFTPTSSGVNEIPVDNIHRNPRQPRTRIDNQELEELAGSIQEHGVIQPLIVSHGPEAGQYTLIAGERRLRAAQQAGLTTVPAIVRESSEQERLEIALIENVQRADLTPLETADAFRQLADDFNLSHAEIASRVGKSRVAVTNKLRLLNLPTSIQEALLNLEISEGHARALLALPTTQAQAMALQTILSKGLNVRQTEKLVRRLTGEKPEPRPKPELSPEVKALEERLRASLGTKVILKHGKRGGTITIHYYSDEELDTLSDRLLP